MSCEWAGFDRSALDRPGDVWHGTQDRLDDGVGERPWRAFLFFGQVRRSVTLESPEKVVETNRAFAAPGGLIRT